MRGNSKVARLSVLLVLLGAVSWFAINRTMEPKIIKASDSTVKQDFRLTASNKWSVEKKQSYIDLAWEDIGSVGESGYQLYRSEDGKNWEKLPLYNNTTESLNDYSDEVSSSQSKYEQMLLDRTVKDDVAPEIPEVKLENVGDHLFNLELDSKDKGKEYQWYVKADTKKSGIQKSDIVKVEVRSDLQGYIYVVDNSPTTIPTVDRDISRAVANINADVDSSESSTTIAGINGESNKWVHIVAVDRSNNVSGVKHVELSSEVKFAELRDVNRYIKFNIERTADVAKLVDISLGSSMEKKMKSLEIKIPKNVEIKDYNNLVLPSDWYKFQNSDENNQKSFTLAMNNNNDINTINNFLESLRFIIKNPTNQTGDIQIVFHELVYTSWEAPDGKKHYYTFVPIQKTWLQAYNLAKKMRYRGLTGYLTTLTSVEEHNYVYENIAKQSGWLGGGRLVKSNGQKINDESTISEKITDYVITGTLVQRWYWVDGPEKGLVFFDKPTYKEGGKAPAGVYQGFNNVAAGGTATEPNNSGGEYILEFAQASAGARTKLWNDLSYNRESYNTGYYVEFSEYGSQVEKEEETDVFASGEIPQKVSIKGFDEKNNSITSGDIIVDQQLRIGKKEVIQPPVIDMYDFVKLTNMDGNLIYPLEYTVSNTFQEGKLIYGDRKLTVNIRQVVMNENSQITIPRKGFASFDSKTLLGEKRDEISLTMPSAADNQALFDTYIIRYKENEPVYNFTPKIPMNYEFVGNVISTKNIQHLPENSSKNNLELDVRVISEFWLTTYVRPVTEKPSLYHWEYKTNKLGEIKVE